MRTLLFAAAALVALCTSSLPLRAQEATALPVPGVTIYPGDTITDATLTERRFRLSRRNIQAVILSKEVLLGKVARRTLLPGQPIPLNAIEEAKLVKRGVPARVVFVEGGLTIFTYAEPLQSGSAGELVRVRNVDSGTVIVGVVQPDGTIMVGAS